MLKLLVPVDGSPHSERLVDYVMRLTSKLDQLDIHLLNVQIPIESGHARMFVPAEDIDAYYREEGLRALQAVRAKLDAAGVRHHWHIAVGHVADTIGRYAEKGDFDQVVMGTHGRSALGHVLLGSVASDVIHRCDIPVTLIR